MHRTRDSEFLVASQIPGYLLGRGSISVTDLRVHWHTGNHALRGDDHDKSCAPSQAKLRYKCTTTQATVPGY
eukprot:2692646-Rhodomonas_salina.2